MKKATKFVNSEKRKSLVMIEKIKEKKSVRKNTNEN
jgi:hypothetical protein